MHLLISFSLIFLVISCDGFQFSPSLSGMGSDKSLAEDLALVYLNNSLPGYKIGPTSTTNDCYHCVKQWLAGTISFNQSVSVQIWTAFTTEFEILIQNSSSPSDQWKSGLNFSYLFNERGVYNVIIFQSHNGTIDYLIQVLDKGDNAFLPILVAFFGYILLGIIIYIGLFIYRKLRPRDFSQPSNTSVNTASPQNNDPQPLKPKKSGRVHSLDTFRGICLTVMIFVNYDGGDYWFFNHSTWNGLTVADLVFPWFIFIMGSAIPLSFDSLLKRKISKFTLFYKIVRRSVILFGLGLFLNNGYEVTQWRIPGVLQRFGIAYLVTSLVVVFIPSRSVSRRKVNKRDEEDPLLQETAPPGMFEDITPFVFQWIFMLCLPILWLFVTFLLPVPNCPTGYLGPGGIGDFGLHQNCTGGAAGYIDKLVFGENHIYQTPTCQEVYETGPYDPEGLLGNLTSIFLCFLGVQVGRTLLTFKPHKQRLTRWLAWGAVLGSLGLLLCEGRQNGGWIPINKNLWTLSFIVVMGGTGNIFLSICYLFVDVFKLWSGAPFIFPGMNSIMIYFGSELLQGNFPFSFNITDPRTHTKVLGSSLLGVSTWILVAYYAYICDFFINI